MDKGRTTTPRTVQVQVLQETEYVTATGTRKRPVTHWETSTKAEGGCRDMASRNQVSTKHHPLLHLGASLEFY